MKLLLILLSLFLLQCAPTYTLYTANVAKEELLVGAKIVSIYPYKNETGTVYFVRYRLPKENK